MRLNVSPSVSLCSVWSGSLTISNWRVDKFGNRRRSWVRKAKAPYVLEGHSSLCDKEHSDEELDQGSLLR